MSIEMFDPETGQLAMTPIRLIKARPDVTIGDLIPQLRALGSTMIPRDGIKTRVCIRIPSFVAADLAGSQIAAILAIPNVGEGSVTALLEQLNRIAAGMGIGTGVVGEHSGEDQESQSGQGQPLEEKAERRKSSFDTDWLESIEVASSLLHREHSLMKLGEFLGVRTELGELPPSLRTLVDHVLDASLSDFELPHIEVLVNEFRMSFTERELCIAEHRIWAVTPSTLDTVGTACGLSRERVRQLQKKIEVRAREALETPHYRGLRLRAELIRAEVGLAVPMDHPLLATCLARATRDLPSDNRDPDTALLLWIAGPYRAEGDWLVADSAIAPSSKQARSDLIGPLGYTTLERAEARLEELGIRRGVHTDWLRDAGNLSVIDAHLLDTGGPIGDQAHRYLAICGTPLTAEEIVSVLDEGRSVRGTKNVLLQDDRFIRVTKSRFALRDWGLDEYTKIHGLMANAIEDAGGAIPLDELVESLTGRFDIAPTSIRMISDRPMFRREQDLVLIRTPDHPYQARTDLSAARGAYRHGDSELCLRLEVGADLARGSGLAVHESIAVWLGVSPGDEMELRGPSGLTLNFTWLPWASPALGSLRAIKEHLVASEGDYVTLLLRRDGSFTTALISRMDLIQPDWAVIGRTMGLEMDDTDQALLGVSEIFGIDESEPETMGFRALRAAVNQGDEFVEGLIRQVMFT